MAGSFLTRFCLFPVWIYDQYQGGTAVIPPPYPPRKKVNGCDIGPVIISVFSISIFITLGYNAFIISFSNTLNTVSGF